MVPYLYFTILHQANELRKRLVQDRCLSLDAREAALLTLESAWREVAHYLATLGSFLVFEGASHP